MRPIRTLASVSRFLTIPLQEISVAKISPGDIWVSPCHKQDGMIYLKGRDDIVFYVYVCILCLFSIISEITII